MLTQQQIAQTEIQILANKTLMRQLAADYRCGAMSDDYRALYSDMAQRLRGIFPFLENSKEFAENFYRKNIDTFVELDKEIVKGMATMI